MAELAGKQALVVGADDIGRGIAARLERAGAVVTLTDMADDAILTDILVLNVLGAPALAPLEHQASTAFDQALQGVAKAAAIMRAALAAMRERGGGRIILVGHRYGETVSEGIGPYNTAAFALIGLMRAAAAEWGQWGVTTNLLVPFADTDELRQAHAKRAKIIDLFTGQVPLRRAGDTIDDIGGAALFLASEDGAFITGQIVYADGGQHIAAPVLNPIRFAT